MKKLEDKSISVPPGENVGGNVFSPGFTTRKNTLSPLQRNAAA